MFLCFQMLIYVFGPGPRYFGVPRAVDLFVPTSTTRASFLLRRPSFSRHPCSKRRSPALPDPFPVSFGSSCPAEPRRKGEPRLPFSQNCSGTLSFEVGDSLVAAIAASYPGKSQEVKVDFRPLVSESAASGGWRKGQKGGNRCSCPQLACDSLGVAPLA